MLIPAVLSSRRQLIETVEIHWSYTPKDFFPAEVDIDSESAIIKIADGTIVATPKVPIGLLNDQFIASIQSAAEDVFIAHQLFNFRDFKVEGYSVQRQSEDGKRHISVFLQSASMIVVGGEADVVLTDAAGKVIADSRRDQVKKAQQLAAKIAVRRRDSLGKWIVDRLRAAIADRNNELVHYYDILDALKSKFGGIRGARGALGITEATWSRMTYLANKAPLLEGRHRGLHFGSLRKATPAELEEARQKIQEVVLKYLDFAK